MKTFVLVTRGRTGSTAVIDELSKSDGLCTTVELFRPEPFTDMVLKKYDYIAPFDKWSKRRWWKNLVPYYRNNAYQAHSYLKHAQSLALSQGAKGFGWKLLSHQFDERPFLVKSLKLLGYRAIYLRRNFCRQVLSGMVANQRGMYNSLEKVVDNRRYHIDPDKFKWHVQWERQCAENDCARLSSEGFDFIEVSYEEFCADRQAFYQKIFGFLGLPLEVPPRATM